MIRFDSISQSKLELEALPFFSPYGTRRRVVHASTDGPLYPARILNGENLFLFFFFRKKPIRLVLAFLMRTPKSSLRSILREPDVNEK